MRTNKYPLTRRPRVRGTNRHTPPQIVILLENISNLKRISSFIPPSGACVKNKRKTSATREYMSVYRPPAGALAAPHRAAAAAPPRKHPLNLHSDRVSYLFSIKRVENFLRSFFIRRWAATLCCRPSPRTSSPALYPYIIKHSTSSYMLRPPVPPVDLSRT